ncbi:hypothetical protein BGW80DRAFT_477778 [Lactifluus volemus]|nr:hypothetical protein BGW80DRAFT_477778 [Lactifluus volemus]
MNRVEATARILGCQHYTLQYYLFARGLSPSLLLLRSINYVPLTVYRTLSSHPSTRLVTYPPPTTKHPPFASFRSLIPIRLLPHTPASVFRGYSRSSITP